MKKFIVATTINPVTEAIEKFQKMDGWELVVVGDKKTPKDYRLERGVYLGPEEQEKLAPELSDALGWNCVQRRNIGFVYAYEHGADIMATVDDDNIPYDFWGKDLLLGREVTVRRYRSKQPAFDPVGATNYPALWHRGFPLEWVNERDYSTHAPDTARFDVQADFWDGDPDVDAVCRIVQRPECDFSPKGFPMAADVIAPFNSQNTFLTRDCLPDYFMFPFVGRMDDIWAGYYLQACGRKVVYGKASVYQKRNPHDLMADMRNEYLGYESNVRLIDALKHSPDSIQRFLPEASWKAFLAYRRRMKG